MIKGEIESLFIRLAVKILKGRNVARASVVSRKDNNAMWYMSEELESIAKRIDSKYE